MAYRLSLIAYRTLSAVMRYRRYAISDKPSAKRVSESIDFTSQLIAPFVDFGLLLGCEVFPIQRQKRTGNNLEGFADGQTKPMIEQSICIETSSFGNQQ
jgi:hypothetical protein